MAAADVHSDLTGDRTAATLLLEEIGYGIVGGVVAGLMIAAIVRAAGRRHLITGAWLQVIPGAGAALAYGIAVGLDGSGFIAAFVAGRSSADCSAAIPPSSTASSTKLEACSAGSPS